ncbi:MAG: ABC transporter ATP-binding protein [Cyclobacteriaceae bacterium]|jgi:Cu-processing system ATP-binding protein|nr:ABC transporter ATP-binding protein [Cyclobacteriaceae bacterium]
MISIQQLRKNFGRLQALKGIDVEFRSGKSYAMIGPNGSGKTTLIKSILGMVIPTSGEILVDGENIRHHWSYREKIGYMPQIGQFPDNMRIGQLLDMIRNIRQHPPAVDEELVEAFQLNAMLDKRMHTLSGGTRQKVSAALAFLFSPPVLFLDEPTSGLDPLSVEILKEKIVHEKERGKLIVITSHILSDLDELTTDVVYMHEGTVKYNNSLETLKEVTGEQKLGKAIANLMRSVSAQHPRIHKSHEKLNTIVL